MHNKTKGVLLGVAAMGLTLWGACGFFRISSRRDIKAYAAMIRSPTPWVDFAFRRASKGELWKSAVYKPIHTDVVGGVNYHVYGERLSDVCLVVGENDGRLASAFFSDGQMLFVFFGEIPPDVRSEPPAPTNAR